MRTALYVTLKPWSGFSQQIAGPFGESERERAHAIADDLFAAVMNDPDGDGMETYSVSEVSVPDGSVFEPGQDNAKYGLPTVASPAAPALADAPRFTVAEARYWIWTRVSSDADDKYPWKVLKFGDPAIESVGDDGPQRWSTGRLAEVGAVITHLPVAVAL